MIRFFPIESPSIVALQVVSGFAQILDGSIRILSLGTVHSTFALSAAMNLVQHRSRLVAARRKKEDHQ